ncbi:MAG: hypothetical protein KKH94_09560 [Candidatus Omnitrophica bacterium]|nr:hypothetical protein [Candidatus Omnitrophota bacterium]
MLNFLKGKKTYLVVGVGVILNGLMAMDVIPQSLLPVVNSILGFLGMGTLRAGIAENGKK